MTMPRQLSLSLLLIVTSILIAGNPAPKASTAVSPPQAVSAPAEQACVSPSVYWRSNSGAWPVESLVLGDPAFAGHTYAKSELLSILDNPTTLDASVVLARELIAAKLNLARGSNPAPIETSIRHADSLLGTFRSRLPFGVAGNTPIGADMLGKASALQAYNTGQIPFSCGTANRAPVAHAGTDQTVPPGTRVLLDGSGSSDPDGNALLFKWVIVAKPAGSAATLTDRSAVRPAIIADLPGTYDIRLVVSDGQRESAPATVRISATGNSRPVAHAGPDQTVALGAMVHLTGALSTDPDGDALTFAWTLAATPADSAAALDAPTSVTPSFVADRAGQYRIDLIVTDGSLPSVADSVTISTINTAPVAHAGPDITAAVGETITLDGSGSTDVDGNPLSYRWTLVSRPETSTTVLLNPTTVSPSFVLDRAGEYVAQLIVNDGVIDSAPDTVVIATTNTRPIANAGANQNALTGDTVQLDGSASTDADGDAITYAWSFTVRPAGSAAAFGDATLVRPIFTPDVAGTYVAQLIVSDATTTSDPATVTVTVSQRPPDNRPPTAEAGEPQSVALGATVALDGSASRDPDGDTLTFRWSLTAPAGSAAVLSDSTIVDPTFVADVQGNYVVQLIVNDGTIDSAPDTVSISTQNSTPVARAGDDQFVATGSTVQLDGNDSSDPDGSSLIFSWSLISRPDGSTAALVNPATATPTLAADRDGVYVAQLTVGDGLLVSAPDTIAITAAPGVDLRVTMSVPSDTQSPGHSLHWFIQVDNLSPTTADDVVVRALVPAGYTLTSIFAGFPGTYDPATGLWNIGSILPNNSRQLGFSITINRTGPYNLRAEIVESSAPDPNPANNLVTASPSFNMNADLRMTFFTFGPGNRVPGEIIGVFVFVLNDGPAPTSDVSGSFPIPAGYTLISATPGSPAISYDPATGNFNIPDLPHAAQQFVSFQVRVNPTGSTTTVGTITSSSAPDPNLANNSVTMPPINRPPVAHAGPDQSAGTHATVTLDGTASFDAEAQPITFAWVTTLRPINSAATLSSTTATSPRFVPDLPGPYAFRLVVTDSLGVQSIADDVSVTVALTNRAPAIVSVPAVSAFVGQSYQYDVNATDPDAGDVLTYSLATAPAGMTIDPSSGVIAWTPTDAQGGQQSVLVRVQDVAGLFATQGYVVQVSSSSNRAPVAHDDSFNVRVSESLSVAAPGVISNDIDESPLSARIISPPSNGTARLNPDGSFTYTPNTLQEGELVLADNVNLAARMPGVIATGGGNPQNAIDESFVTNWDSNAGTLDILFPVDVTVREVQVIGTRVLHVHKTSAGIFELLSSTGTVLHNSGTVEIPGPLFDATLRLPNLAGVRRVRFRPTATNTGFDFFATITELRVIGSGLMRRPRFVEPNLVQLLPTTVTASSEFGHNVKDSLIDDSDGSTWYSHGSPGDFIEVTFPQDVTVTELRSLNPGGRPDGFGSSNPIDCFGTFTLLDAGRAVIFTSGLVNEPSGFVHPSDFFTLPVPTVAGVRHVRYTMSSCTGLFPAGFAEWRVVGTADVTTPAFSLAKKFQALHGREAHSTPIVVNLSDDNGDGLINADDIPDIVVPVEALDDQLRGEIKAISGADGRELFTAGSPNLVSPWSELAAADLDGDGDPEIVAVHADQSHLIAFDHTGAVHWISDAHAVPTFALGAGVAVGAIAIANLDGTGGPEIVVGASVFDANGHLIADGRTLGGTTGGAGLRSRMSAIADIDLDGAPELVAGPTAYRLAGTLSRVWQRSDRPDGYVAIANLDDDPQAEIVIVANGVVYVLNHDGSDYQGWNAPSHAPVAIPGGGQGGAPLIVDVDGDGRPEIGVAGGSKFVVFNRDGSVRWHSAISDRTSNATGAVAFDLNGDGEVEVIYRDEFFLRIYRGADGVLLVKTRVGSATWGEEPVVADVDNDGHADIIVSSDLFGQTVNDTGIIVYQDVANRWKRTRRIWNQHSYHVTNVNEDASIPVHELPHWLVPGLNSFRTNAFVPGESADETDSFTYVASDGVLDSNAATVSIAIRTPNSAPQFVSTPVTTAAGGVFYAYVAQAEDPDAGDVLTFSLPTAPAGMTIDPTSGLVAWTPAAAQTGAHQVVVKVADVRGLYAVQGYTVTVGGSITVPDVVGQLESAAATTITGAGLSVGAITSRHSASVATGSVISQNPAAGSAAAPDAPVNLVVSLGAPPVGTVPNVIGLTQSVAVLDVETAGYGTSIATAHSGTVPPGHVMSQNPVGGTVAATGTAVNLVVSLGLPPGELDLDGDGFTGDQGDCNDANAAINPAAFDIPGDGIDQNCNGVDSIIGDDVAPIAAIDTPLADAEITMPADVIGTATDANFLRYTLRIAEVDADVFRTIGSGVTAVTSAVLGRVDPTLLENGLYRVQLIVEDINGQITIAESVYRVNGEAKIGVLSLAFVDLQVPVSGIPITVVRTYDSRVKSRRDFGVGWSLDIKAGTYRNNRVPGDGWTITTAPGPFGLPCQIVNEPRSHFTEVRLSDRESYHFRPRLTNLAALVGGCVGTFTYELVHGTLDGATLQVIGGSDFIYTSGDVLTHFDGGADTGLVFDPRRVRLTTIDGRIMDFDRVAGITRIEDSNQNTLTITPGGISHTSGRSIAFERDSLGRIVRITDPRGNTLAYSYTGEDLTAFVDQGENQTTFSYDGQHNLLEIRDPLGHQAVRSEYDADGRLIAVTDARGTRTTFTHDVDGREEVIVDGAGHPMRVVYDERGNVRSHEKTVTIDGVPTVARSEHQFDARGNETVTVDPDGRRQENTWDQFGNQLATIIDPAGLNIQYESTYTPAGNPLTETDANGDTVSYSLDRNGNPTTWVDVDGRSTAIGHDRSGNVTRVTDPDGRVTQVSYNADGRVLSRTDSLGHVISYTYDAGGNTLTETTSRTIDGVLRLLTTRFQYDALNRVTQMVDPTGQTVRMTYDALGRIASRIDPLGRTTTFQYDAVGALTRTVYPDDTTEVREYDTRGDLIRVVDRDGLVTRYTYDELRRRVTVVAPSGGITRTIYSAGGLVTAMVNPDGSRTEYEYDQARRRVLERKPEVTEGLTEDVIRPEWRYEYDAGSRLTAVIDPGNNRRTLSHDSVARTTTSRFPDGTEIVTHRDQWGRVVRSVDQEGQATTFGYLSDTSRLATVTAPAPAPGQPTPIWQYGYDEAGNRIFQTDPLGRVTRFSYDEAGRLARLTQPGGESRTFVYDMASRLQRLTDFDGASSTFEYDDADRIVRRLLADGTQTTFAYTPGGRRTRVTDARGNTEYSYDAAGRLAALTQPEAGVIQYFYDVNNRVTAIMAPSGTTAYEYDAMGRLLEAETETGATRYGYDAIGNVIGIAMPNGVTGSFGYDTRNQLTSLAYRRGATTLASFGYQYTPAGRRSMITETNATTTFQYDRMGRLVQETRAGTTPFNRVFEYDLAGNRTRVITDGVPTSFTYDVNDRVLTAGGISYTYDAKGNPTSRNNAGALTTYEWTPDNRLASLTTAAGEVGFEYDADGMRVATHSSAGTTRYLIDPQNPSRLRQVIEERDDTGALAARYNYGLGPISAERGGAEQFYQTDGQSSVRLLTDAAGQVTDRYSYDAFGNVIEQAGSSPNNYLYTGQQLDRRDNLYYLRNRYYDPVIGRFLGLDPVDGDPRRPLSMHRFNYAGNDPVNYADPNGDFFTILGVSLAELESNAGRAIEYTHHGLKVCRIKAFRAVASAAVMMKELALGSEGLTIASNLVSTSLSLTTGPNGGPSLGGNLTLRLIQFENPAAKSGEVEKIEATAAFPNPYDVDIELKGKSKNGPELSNQLQLTHYPTWRLRGFQSSAGEEFPVCNIEICEIKDLAKVLWTVKATIGAQNGNMTGGIEWGIKFDAPFLPDLSIALVQWP